MFGRTASPPAHGFVASREADSRETTGVSANASWSVGACPRIWFAVRILVEHSAAYRKVPGRLREGDRREGSPTLSSAGGVEGAEEDDKVLQELAVAVELKVEQHLRESSETVPRRLREGVSRKTRAERGGTPAAAPCTAGACRPACLQGPEQVHSAAVPRSAPARSLASQPPRRRSPAESEARCGGVALPPPLPLLLPRGAVSLRRGRPPDTDTHRSREELPRSARSEVRTPSALASRGGGPRPRARTCGAGDVSWTCPATCRCRVRWRVHVQHNVPPLLLLHHAARLCED